MVNAPITGPAHSVGLVIVELIVMKSNPPVPRWYHIGMLGIRERGYPLANIHLEVLNTPTPIPGLCSPLKDLIPIESSAGLSQDKGKGKATEAMDEGKSERACLVSLTISKFEGAFHGGSSAFVYNLIDDAHGDSDPEGPRESLEDWMTDWSYQDANEEPIESLVLCR